MMRAIRFASQLNFDIEEKTFSSITDNAERIKIVSVERVTDELNKIILSKKPSYGFKLLFTSKISPSTSSSKSSSISLCILGGSLR